MKKVHDLTPGRWLLPLILSSLVALSAAADHVEMQNGDRYNGKVLSLNSESLVLQNEHLGTISLPRSKVTLINFGTAQIAAKAQPATTNAAVVRTNSAPAPTGVLAGLASNSNLIQRVQKQYLASAGPGAQEKFDELVSGLLSGKLTVEDVRAQAKATAEQVRAARKDMDESSRWAIDGYLAILDQFLASGDPGDKTGTNAPSRPAKDKAIDSLLEE